MPAMNSISKRDLSRVVMIAFLVLVLIVDPRYYTERLPYFYAAKYSLVIVISLRILMLWSRKSYVPIWANSVLSLFAVYILMSAFWSENVVSASIQASSVALLMLVAIFLPFKLSGFEKFAGVIVCCVCATGILGFVLYLVAPSIVTEEFFKNAGDFRGIYNQKNQAAVFFAIALTLLVSQPAGFLGRNRMGFRYVLIFIMLALFVMTDSRGGALWLVVFLASQICIPRGRSRSIVATFSLLTLYLLVVLSLASIGISGDELKFLGMEVSTSSRIHLWSFGLDQFQDTPVFGTGFDGFWTEEMSSYYLLRNGWVLENFHNGYLTILIEGGIVGFILFVLWLTIAAVKLFFAAVRTGDSLYRSALGSLLAFAAYNFIESAAWRSPGIVSLYVYSHVSYACLNLMMAKIQRPLLNREENYA